MPLDLIVGPANAGKVAELYRRHRASLEAGGLALLVVPNLPALWRAERELLQRGVLLGGLVVTFDGVFERALRLAGADRAALPPARRRLELARLIAGVELGTIGVSAAGARFPDALGRLFDRLGSALVDPAAFAAAAAGDDAGEDLARLYAAWWARLDELGAWDAPRRRVEACGLLAREVTAWDGTPLHVQGFEDLSHAQETVVRLIAERAGAVVTLPYEPGRAAFAALSGSVARLAEGSEIHEMAPLTGQRPARLEQLERRLFEPGETPPADPEDASVTFLEVAGGRAEADLVVADVAAALRAGTEAGRIAIVTPRDPVGWPELAEALRRAGIPHVMERSTSVGRTAFGFALDHLMRFAWDADAVRRDLFSFLRSPWSGLPRRRVDFVEGRLRGRAINEAPGVEASVTELLGGGLQAVELLRSAGDVRVSLAETVRRMVVAAHGLEARGIAPAERVDLAAARAVLRVLDDVADLQPAPSREELRGLLLRARVDVREDATARVLVCDLRAARTLDADLVIVLGLEQGGLSSRGDDAFLPDGLRDALGDGLQTPEAGDLDRHLLYVALARGRQRVVVCRRVASDDGRPLEPSPLWHDVVRAAGGAAPVVRRGLADVSWTVAAAPTPRERARAVSRLAADDPRRAERIADADGLTRRLRRARTAYQRPTRIRDPQVLADLAALDRFPVTALERFGDCSSWWFVERHLSPRDIDAAYDARLAGTIAHGALQRFYKGLPATFGKDRLEPGDAEKAEEVIRELVNESMRGQTLPSDTLEARIVARRVARDLARFVRQDAESPSPLAATRLEVGFGGANSAPGLKEGLKIEDFAVAGKIDRIDTDPMFTAHALVQDYKSGKTAWTARQLNDEGRLQIPLYILAARELLGLEPIGGLYRALGPGGGARGVVDRDAADVAPPGLVKTDLVAPEDLWQIVSVAREQAIEIVGRVRVGDIRHDPRGGSCPWYCPWAGVCRIAR